MNPRERAGQQLFHDLRTVGPYYQRFRSPSTGADWPIPATNRQAPAANPPPAPIAGPGPLVPGVFLSVAQIADPGFSSLVCAGRQYASDTAPPSYLEPAFGGGWRNQGAAAQPIDLAGAWAPINDANFGFGPFLAPPGTFYPIFPNPPANGRFGTAQAVAYPDEAEVPPIAGWRLDAEYHARGIGIYLWSGIIPVNAEADGLDFTATMGANEQLYLQIYPVASGAYIASAENDGPNDLALPQDGPTGYWILECDLPGRPLSMCNQNARGNPWMAVSALYGTPT